MPSRRQLIVEEMFNRVQAISQANGFQTDVGLRAFLGEKGELGPDDPDQAVVLIAGDEESGWQRPGLAFLLVLPFSVRALAKDSLDVPWLTIEAIVGDIKTAIEAGGDARFGGLLNSEIERGPVVVLDREPGSQTVGAAVVYRCSWKECFGAP
jgi:hypothetical protein